MPATTARPRPMAVAETITWPEGYDPDVQEARASRGRSLPTSTFVPEDNANVVTAMSPHTAAAR